MAMTKKQTFAIVGGAVVLCVISGLVGASIAGKFDVTWGENFEVDFGQSISIILSALGAILTALAILFAILAIVGWSTFSAQVDSNVRRYIEDDFEKKGPLFEEVVKDLTPKLKEVLKPELEAAMYQGVGPDEGEDFEVDDDETEGGVT